MHTAGVRRFVRTFATVGLIASIATTCSNNEANREHCGIGASCATTIVNVTAVSTTVTASIAPSSTVSSPETAAAPSTTSTAVATTTLNTGTFEVPTGDVQVHSGDMFLVHADGDLWLHPGLLDGRPGRPVRLADMGDPRIPVTEGEGPNTIENVAGEVGGAVYFSDCCEPIAGDARAATAPDTVKHVGYGISLVLSPDRTRLASSNTFGLQVWDLSKGGSTYRELNTTAPQIHPWDLIWSADGQRLIMLYLDEHGAALLPYSATDDLIPGAAVPLDTRFAPVQSPGMQFAGHGPNGEIAVSFYGNDQTTIRFYDPVTLIEIPSVRRELPTGVTSVRLASDGVGLLWIDHETLWYLPRPGATLNLGRGYTGAWFAT